MTHSQQEEEIYTLILDTDEKMVDDAMQYLDDDVDVTQFLMGFKPRHRFVGYISTIAFLMNKVNELTERVKELEAKKEKKGWFF